MNELTQRAQRYLNQLEPHQLGWEGAKIIEELLSALGEKAEAASSPDRPTPTPAPGTAAPRPCTCHPEDKPPTPCAKQYALHECLRFHASRLERERDEAYNAGIEAALDIISQEICDCCWNEYAKDAANHLVGVIEGLKKGA
jgi:hypothetical protein